MHFFEPAIAYAASRSFESSVASGGGFFGFLFGTYQGLGVLVGSFLILSFIIAFILERRTRKVFKDRGPAAPGSSFFDDEEDETSE